MSALAFLVRGRSVDLVAMTARRALQETLGLAEEVVDLMRDEFTVVEDVAPGDALAWTRALTAHQHWFNPNKHRFASYVTAPGVADVARNDRAWPSPWFRKLVETDRPDLQGGDDASLDRWIAAPPASGAFAVTLAAWDEEDGLGRLPSGHWPAADRTMLRGVLWTLVLRADDAATAARRAEAIAVTRTRSEGLLVHPHMEGWSFVAPPRPLESAGASA